MLRGPHLDNLTFNFKGATRRSAPFRFTSPCLKCDPLAVVAKTSALLGWHLGTFLFCRQFGTLLVGVVIRDVLK